jgi:hypothetical protein
MKVKVTHIEDLTYCDEPEYFYAGPERTDYMLEGIDCTVEEFLSVFLPTTNGFDLIAITGGMTDIGGCGLGLELGSVICVESKIEVTVIKPVEEPVVGLGFKELIDESCKRAKEDIEFMVHDARRKLGLTSEDLFDLDMMFAEDPPF